MLSASRLSFSYQPDRPVLSDLSFKTGPGRILGLSGTNGSGKSTLINILAGLLNPTSGEVRLNDLSPEATLARLRGSSAIVPQNIGHWLLGETGAEDLSLSLDPGDPEVKERLERLIEAWDLGSFLNQPVETLSPGQKKRLALASALAVEPEALFLDEPTGGLDWPGAQGVRRDLARLKEVGAIVVIITHEPDLVADLVDDWLFLKKGGGHFFGRPGPAEMEEYQVRPFVPGRRAGA